MKQQRQNKPSKKQNQDQGNHPPGQPSKKVPEFFRMRVGFHRYPLEDIYLLSRALAHHHRIQYKHRYAKRDLLVSLAD